MLSHLTSPPPVPTDDGDRLSQASNTRSYRRFINLALSAAPIFDWLFADKCNAFHPNTAPLSAASFQNAPVAFRLSYHLNPESFSLSRPFIELPPSLDSYDQHVDILLTPATKRSGVLLGYALIIPHSDSPLFQPITPRTKSSSFFNARFAFCPARNQLLVIAHDVSPSKTIVLGSILRDKFTRERFMVVLPNDQYVYPKLPDSPIAISRNIAYSVHDPSENAASPAEPPTKRTRATPPPTNDPTALLNWLCQDGASQNAGHRAPSPDPHTDIESDMSRSDDVPPAGNNAIISSAHAITSMIYGRFFIPRFYRARIAANGLPSTGMLGLASSIVAPLEEPLRAQLVRDMAYQHYASAFCVASDSLLPPLHTRIPALIPPPTPMPSSRAENEAKAQRKARYEARRERNRISAARCNRRKREGELRIESELKLLRTRELTLRLKQSELQEENHRLHGLANNSVE